jgi:hypothetical protein
VSNQYYLAEFFTSKFGNHSAKITTEKFLKIDEIKDIGKKHVVSTTGEAYENIHLLKCRELITEEGVRSLKFSYSLQKKDILKKLRSQNYNGSMHIIFNHGSSVKIDSIILVPEVSDYQFEFVSSSHPFKSYSELDDDFYTQLEARKNEDAKYFKEVK